MKKNITTLVLSILIMQIGYSQNLSWAKSFGGATTERSNSSALDDSGNLYLTGFFTGTVDFDPGIGTYSLTSQGGSDIFIQKLDPLGNFQWAKRIGGNLSDQGYSIATDDFGNVYVTGSYSLTVDFDPGSGTNNLISEGSSDIFIIKLTSTGNLIWAKSIGGIYSDRGRYLTIDDFGNLYTTGYYSETVDFDPSTGTSNMSSLGGKDVFIQKLDTAGNFQWAKTFGGVSNDNALALTTDISGNIVTTGFFNSTVDFDPNSGITNLSSSGDHDIFIQKLNPSGNLIWAKTMGGIGIDEGVSITTDNSGFIYCTGNFESIVDFDPNSGVTNLTSSGLFDLFVQKLDAAGNLIWVKKIGGNDSERVGSIITDNSNNLLICGSFSGNVDFDPNIGIVNLSSSGGSDIFISKLDTSGNLTWALSMGGSDYDYGNSVNIDNSNHILCSGYFNDISDFDPQSGITNLTSNGGSDIFAIKLTECTGSTPPIPTITNLPPISGNCTILPSPPSAVDGCGNSIIGITNTTFPITTPGTTSVTWTYDDGNGNTSNQNQDFTIIPIDTTISQNGNTLSSNQNGAIYQWIDCSTNTAINGETNQTLTPNSDGYYAVEISLNSCIDTTECVLFNTIAVQEPKEVDNIQIFPVPFSDVFYINLDKINEASISVYNLEGKTMLQSEITNHSTLQFQLDEPSGIYILEVISDEYTKRYKLIKK